MYKVFQILFKIENEHPISVPVNLSSNIFGMLQKWPFRLVSMYKLILNYFFFKSINYWNCNENSIFVPVNLWSNIFGMLRKWPFRLVSMWKLIKKMFSPKVSTTAVYIFRFWFHYFRSLRKQNSCWYPSMFLLYQLTNYYFEL